MKSDGSRVTNKYCSEARMYTKIILVELYSENQPLRNKENKAFIYNICINLHIRVCCKLKKKVMTDIKW